MAEVLNSVLILLLDFYFHIVKPLMPILQLLPILSVCEQLDCATSFKSSDLAGQSIITQQCQILVLMILDGTFHKVDSCAKVT